MEGLNPSEWRQTRNRSEDRSEMGEWEEMREGKQFLVCKIN